MNTASIHLYRHLLRKLRLLPEKSKAYYTIHIRENFTSHIDEQDPQRVQNIISKAYQDADWIVNKGMPAWLPSVVYTAIWMIVSSSLIVLNKRLMVDEGFNFPLALTAAGQTVSCLLGVFVAKLGRVKIRKPPSLAFFLSQLLPIVFCSAATLFYGNIAYLHLSVAFIQILKVAAPLFTLVASVSMGLQRLSWTQAQAMILILLGSSAATLVESGTAGFSWRGLSFMLGSSFLEAIKVAYMQLLLGPFSYTALELLVYLGLPTAAVLFAASFVIEREGLMSVGFPLIAEKPFLYLVAVTLGFGVNMSTALAIKATSSLTFKVWGCVKNTAVVLIGVFLGDNVNIWQILGYALSMAGFMLYTCSRSGKVKEKL